MTTTVFYERRKEIKSIDFQDRRIAQRRKHEAPISQEHRRPASQVRRYERKAFKIPVRLRIQEKEISGYTHDICPEGLLVFTDTALSVGIPMTLKFSFGEHVCHLNVSGQVVFCRVSENSGPTQHAIGIKFSGIRDFEKNILTSAIEELKHSPTTQEKSLLKILVSQDALALGTADFGVRTSSFAPKEEIIKHDRRSRFRVKEIVPISLVIREHATRKRKVLQGETINISLSGLSVATRCALSRIDTGTAQILLPGALYPIKVRVKIKWWNDEERHYGIEFTNSPENNLVELEKFVKDSESFITDRRHEVRRQVGKSRSYGSGTGDHLSKSERRRVIRRITDFWEFAAARGGNRLSITREELLPKENEKDYTLETARKRREWLSGKRGVSFKHISVFSQDPLNMQGNIENLIGVAHVPIGIAGPLRVNGDYATGIYYVPMATTEGVLVISYTLAMTIITHSGGVGTKILRDEMHISPVFGFDTVRTASYFAEWVKTNFYVIKREAEKTTLYGKLLRVEPYIFNNYVVLKFCYHTGDAMGMNMINIATERACKFIVSTVKPEKFYIRSNFSSDKKVSAHNFICGKGKTVIADAIIHRKHIERFNTTPEEMEAYYRTVLFTSSHAGMIGMNGQVANAIAALFIALGQDVAQVANSFVSNTTFEVDKNGDLYISVYLPNLIVGTVGGGTDLGSQQECLKLIDCYGEGKSQKLAEIIAATALAGELAICLSIANGTFVKSHSIFGRKRVYNP